MIINTGTHSIFFYNGLFSLLISIPITFFIFIKSEKYVLVFTILFSFLLHFTIFLLIPVTIDRSISVNLLQNLAYKYDDELFEYEDIKNQIIYYTTSQEFTDKRIDEQISSKNIIVEGNSYKMTKSGRFIVKIFEIVSKIYGN